MNIKCTNLIVSPNDLEVRHSGVPTAHAVRLDGGECDDVAAAEEREKEAKESASKLLWMVRFEHRPRDLQRAPASRHVCRAARQREPSSKQNNAQSKWRANTYTARRR